MKPVRKVATALKALFVGLCFATSGIAYGAEVGCLNSDPMPASIAAGSETVSFNITWATGRTARIDLWRLSCAPNASRLFIKATPTQGLPSICGFTMIQGGSQYNNIRATQDVAGSSSFCADLFVPTTLRITQSPFDPQFNPALALRLIYTGISGSYFGDLAAAGTATPADISPVVGLWWNPNESGSGYAIDVKHGVMVMTIYSYNANGDPEWYYVAGPLTNGGRNFTSMLDRYRGGQCISCPYTGRPTAAGNAGTISVSFSSATAATVTLPGGRVTNIQPQPF